MTIESLPISRTKTPEIPPSRFERKAENSDSDCSDYNDVRKDQDKIEKCRRQIRLLDEETKHLKSQTTKVIEIQKVKGDLVGRGKFTDELLSEAQSKKSTSS